jgi:thioredoxin-related protein
MKKIALLTLLSLLAFPAFSAEVWLTDFAKAQEQAKKEGKNVLLNFTGSDWCPACKLLKKEIFTTKEFLDFAQKKLVLVELEFPQDKPQAPDLKRTNQELYELFRIDAFPAVVITDSSGKKLFRLDGFEGEKPAEYIAKLEKGMKK